MQSFSSFAISRVGLFFGVEAPQISYHFFMRNRRLPTSVGFVHPRKPTDAFQSMLICSFAICPILAVRRLSKIFKSVIRFISVNMINLVNGHFASHIKPRQTMAGICLRINFNVNVPFIFLQISSFLPNLYFWPRHRPVKKPCGWIVGEDGCKVLMVHKGILPDHETDCKTEGS